MPRSILTEFRVGLFVTVGLLLAMTVIFMVGSENRLFERHYTLYANFKSISGLRVGAPVQLAGLKVGFVDGIKLESEVDKQQITVKLRIKRSFQERIRGDSVATVETQGLLGDKYIHISMGSEVQPVIPDKGLIPSKETTSIFALADKAGSIMDNIGHASEALNDLLSSVEGKHGQSDLRAIISSLRTSIEEIEKGKGLIHSMIYDPEGAKVINGLAKTMKSLGDAMAEGEGGKSPGVLANLKQSSADLRAIMSSIRKGEGSLGMMINDPALYDDLRALVGRANRNVLLRAVIRSTIEENDRQVLK